VVRDPKSDLPPVQRRQITNQATEGKMTARRTRKTSRKVKNLTARKVSSKESRRVKGGYIGETEKLKALGARDGTSNT
jgi:hypothetical protein